MKKIYITFLCLCFSGLLLLTGCSKEDPVVNDNDYTNVNKPSTKDLTELLDTEPEDLTEEDIDQINYLTGSMSEEEYEQKHGHPVMDAISGAIWGSWQKIDIPGAVCGNGSPYKIFVMRAQSFLDKQAGNDKRLLIYLEPGGACWDFPSCTGQGGIRGAANPNGIPDNYMNLGDLIDPNKEGGSPMAAISPVLLKNHPTFRNVETSKWNKVFIPYCTGDIFGGNKVVTYDGTDDDGNEVESEFHHVGATNIEKVIEYLKYEFSNPEEMMVTGCSAGGTGALVNYYFFRKELNPEKSYLLVDSGPIYSATPELGNHYPLHQKISEAWNTDYIKEKLLYDSQYYKDGHTDGNNFGVVSEALAYEFPDDELGITLFKLDANYSMYSYERFFELDENIPEDFEAILQLWGEDIERMVTQYDEWDNLSYFIPYYRNLNSSHCTCIVEFGGTEYYDEGIDVGDYIDDMLDGNGVTSYYERYNPDDFSVTDFWMVLAGLLL